VLERLSDCESREAVSVGSGVMPRGLRVAATCVGLDEVVAAAFRSLRNRDVPFLRPPFQPALKLLGNVAQRVPAHRVKLPVGVEEADDALRLLERLNQPVQQDAIKAPAINSAQSSGWC